MEVVKMWWHLNLTGQALYKNSASNTSVCGANCIQLPGSQDGFDLPGSFGQVP
jgi:hypothetical protein